MASSSFTLEVRATPPLGSITINIPIIQPPESHKRSILAVTLVCLLLSWIIVILRLWTRASIVRKVYYDDITMFIALLLLTGFCGMITAQTFLVSNRDFLPGSMMNAITNLMLLLETFYIVTMVILKISLSIFFLRIMAMRVERNAVYVILAISTVTGLAYFFFCLFQCGLPVEAIFFWQRRVLNMCVSNSAALAMVYTHGAITSATDLSLALLPIPMLLKSRISTKEKWIVSGIFLLATAGFMASLARMKWVPSIVEDDYNFVTNVEMLVIFSLIEMAMGVCACSLATLRPLLRSWVQTYRSRSSRTGSSRSLRSKIFGQSSYATDQSNEPSNSKQTSQDENQATSIGTPKMAQSFHSPDSIYIPEYWNKTSSGEHKDNFGISGSSDLCNAQVSWDATHSGNTDSLKQDPPYARFNATPLLLRDRISADVHHRSVESVGMAVPYNPTILVPPQKAVVSDQHRYHDENDLPDIEEEGESISSRNQHRATWWPLPRSYILPPNE